MSFMNVNSRIFAMCHLEWVPGSPCQSMAIGIKSYGRPGSYPDLALHSARNGFPGIDTMLRGISEE